MQRFLDILLSGIALLVLSPLLVPIAIILRCTGEREVFFTQQRIGLGGKKFGLYKFATMLKNSPNIGTGTVTLKHDPRILPVGRFLRKTKINELPQLLNILKGDMSIIGPRPQTRRCFDAFPEASQAEIIKVRPGLSGIGSIVFRDEEEMMHAHADPDAFYDSVIMPYKGELEEWYVAHAGVRTYLKCIVLTAWVIVFPRSRAPWKVLFGLPLPPPRLSDRRAGRGIMQRREIYRQVARLHMDCIDRGFLRQLGERFLALMYEAIDEDPNSVLLTTSADGHVVGFVAGGVGMRSIYLGMLRKSPWLAVALMPSLLDPARLRRIVEILRYGKKGVGSSIGLPHAELLSIAVAVSFRGDHRAEKLYRLLVDFFAERGIGKFKIIVGQDLKPAQRFYAKMGAIPIGELQVHDGDLASIVYVQRISET